MSLCPAIIYLLKVSNRTTIKRYEICSRLTINTSERPYWRSSGAFIVYFEHISYLLLCFYCWLWKSKCLVGGFLIPNFEKIQHVNIALLLLTMSMYLSSELLLLFLHNRALRQNVVVITKTFDQKNFSVLLGNTFRCITEVNSYILPCAFLSKNFFHSFELSFYRKMIVLAQIENLNFKELYFHFV